MKCPIGLMFCQKKYMIDILKAFRMHDCKPIKTPMETNANLGKTEGCLIDDVKRYQQMVGKLAHLTISRPDMA